MTEISFEKNYKGEKYRTFPFYRDGKPLTGAQWGLTLLAAGSMRFRWNEENENRNKMLASICSDFGGKVISQVQLDHTKLVYSVDSSLDTENKIGDGIITKNAELLPLVTVADCLPVYLYEAESGFFGTIHSGWKGTGIAANAIKLAAEKYGAKAENISVAIGPHIQDCCYIVNKERADYFASNFSPDCVRPVTSAEDFSQVAKNWNCGPGELFHLSLLKANLALLKSCNIRDENIVISKDCTCHTEIFGSNRRESSLGKAFTVQAAFTVKTL